MVEFNGYAYKYPNREPLSGVEFQLFDRFSLSGSPPFTGITEPDGYYEISVPRESISAPGSPLLRDGIRPGFYIDPDLALIHSEKNIDPDPVETIIEEDFYFGRYTSLELSWRLNGDSAILIITNSHEFIDSIEYRFYDDRFEHSTNYSSLLDIRLKYDPNPNYMINWTEYREDTVSFLKVSEILVELSGNYYRIPN